MKTLVFDLEKGGRDKAMRDAIKLFNRAGAKVVSSDVDKTLSRSAGVSYRKVNFTFADNQTVTFSIKSTGDVFQVKVNNRLVPLRNQDDHTLAIEEIAERMDAGRGAFQRSLARVRVPLPPSIRTSRASMITALTARRDDLKTAIEGATSALEKLRPVPA